MGPFALSVPRVYDAKVSSGAEAELGYANYSYTEGEASTHAATMRVYYPIVSNRVAVEVSMVPFEKYKYSDAVADQFHSIDTEGSGGGDVYINTYIQVLQENKRRPDVAVRYGMRTASGSNVNAARHTDSPGYFMDASIGKTVFEEDLQSLRFYALAGFYCWQQEDVSKRQNDAIMYGLGMAYHLDDWLVQWDLGGYYGYKNDGDCPAVLKFQVDAPLNDQWKLRGVYEKGLADFPYKGYHLRLVYSFKGGQCR